MKDCISLEVAQKLQKAGYKSEHEYYWLIVLDNFNVAPELRRGKRTEGKSGNYGSSDRGDWEEKVYSAPTATQLAEELPARIKDGEYWSVLQIHKHANFEATYTTYKEGIGYIFGGYEKGSRHHGTLPDALGLMMVYLLENKLI